MFDPANHTLKTVKNPPLLLYLEVPLMDHYNVSWCQFLSLWSRCKFIDRLILKLTDVLFFPPPPPHTFPILSLFSSTERRDAQLPTKSHKPLDKPQSIGGIIPSSSERPRKQNNEREILQNIKMSELLQGVFLTGVLNLKLSVRKLS